LLVFFALFPCRTQPFYTVSVEKREGKRGLCWSNGKATSSSELTAAAAAAAACC